VHVVKPVGQWALLFALSWVLAAVMTTMGFGAGILVGPMVIAMIMGLAGSAIAVPRPAFNLAQGLTGCVIAASLNLDVLHTVAANWWPMLLAVIVTVSAATLIGWLLMRMSPLPGTTGAWGTLPGAAPAMAALADQYGGDARMVAIMQYLRVALVVGSGSIVSHALASWLTPSTSAAHGAMTQLALPGAGAHPIMNIGVTLAIAVLGSYVGMRSRIIAGTLMMPMVVGVIANGTGWVTLHVPQVALIGAFATIGWTIGLKFRRDLARPLLYAFPAMCCGILALMLVCGMSAWLLTLITPIDIVTAYLSTTPGGLESVAVIAIGVDADLGFITALQTMRLVAVLMLGPIIARALSRQHAAHVARESRQIA